MKDCMQIKSKEQNLKLWNQGRFGNTLRTWPRIKAAYQDRTFDGPYVIRSRKPGGLCLYHGLPNRVCLSARILYTEEHKDCYVNERMPDEFVTIQGEVRRGLTGLELFYSDMKGHMREVLKKKPMHADGLTAKLIIERALPDHAEYIWDLLDEFEDHVVEFTAFSRGVGSRGWPLIIWECRAY